MYGYIYETTNMINGKKYIGKHKSNVFDKKYYGSGVGLNFAIKKYGKENFKVRIIEKINTNQKELDLKEIYWIKYFNAVKDKEYYNCSYGGENEGWSGVNKALKENGFSEETRRKMSASRKGTKHPMYGKKHKKESIEKMSKAKRGKKLTVENKKKISESLKGENAPWYGKHLTESTKMKISEATKKRNLVKENNPFYGKHHTEEVKKKLSKFKKGKKLSEEHKRKISEALRGHIAFNKGETPHNKNKICINNKVQNKYILEEELDYYIKIGWNLGGKSRLRRLKEY